MRSDNPFIDLRKESGNSTSTGPLLFLSFDGVVHPHLQEGIPRSWDSGVLPLLGIRFFHPKPMQQIFRVCDALGAKIVLTTSWRHTGFELSEFNQVFRGLIIGKTPDRSGNLGDRGLREREIRAYLEGCDEGQRYAIIDDKPHYFSAETPNLFLVDPAKRFTDEMAERVIAALS